MARVMGTIYSCTGAVALAFCIGCRDYSSAHVGVQSGSGKQIGLVALPTSIQFGEVITQKKAAKTIRLVNATDSPIAISLAETSCACTGATVSKSVLQPNEESLLTVSLKPSSIPAQRSGSVLIRYRSDTARELIVPLTATIVAEWLSIPARLEAVVDSANEKGPFNLSIYNNSGAAGEYDIVIGKHLRLAPQSRPAPISNNSRVDMLLFPALPKAIDQVDDSIKVISRSTGCVCFEVPVLLTRSRRTFFSPSLIGLGAVRQGEALEAKVNGSAEMMDLLAKNSVVVTSPVFDATATRLSDEACSIHVRIKPNAPLGVFRSSFYRHRDGVLSIDIVGHVVQGKP